MGKRRRHTPEQIIRKLREADRMLGEGAQIAEVARALEVTEAVPRGVVGNESTGVILSVGAAARQPASSSFVLVPTSFVSAPSLSLS